MVVEAVNKTTTGKWDFKALAPLRRNTPPQTVELRKEQQERIPIYEQALTVSVNSKVAHPKFSNYFVKEGVITNSHALPAGNVEYGSCQALHGEESAVAAHRSSLSLSGENPDDLVLGIIAGNPGNVPSPCGNCRDIMRDTFGTNFEIASGAPEGGLAVVVPMSTFTFDTPREVNIGARKRLEVYSALGMNKGDFNSLVAKTIKEGKFLTNDPYCPPKIHPERRYYATIVTNRGLHHGGRDVMVEYHPIYALRDAVRQGRREDDSSGIQSVIVVAEDPNMMPDVMYKDRQHLLEYNLQGELVREEEHDPPVFLVSHDEEGKITGIGKTSIKEWLPLAFSPANFGDEFVNYLASYHKNRTNK
ncbi:MAG: hypothetical protein HY094_04900 [Candidatus Melainabacteria bacterium]|nr:hypothetical protein [Candidatus Melainabacteria bacterium]